LGTSVTSISEGASAANSEAKEERETRRRSRLAGSIPSTVKHRRHGRVLGASRFDGGAQNLTKRWVINGNRSQPSEAQTVLSHHVAAWGLFEKKDIQSLNRVASARTMDGYKIRAKLALSFPRPVTNTEAEDVMMQYARAFAAAVECELSNGDLPFEEHELHQRMTDAVQALPKKNIRLIGLHVWHKGAVSSGSMLAVTDGKATVPAMSAVASSHTRPKTPSSSAAHTAATIKPPQPAGGAPLASVNAPASARSQPAVTVPAPDPAQSAQRAAAARPATPSATRGAVPGATPSATPTAAASVTKPAPAPAALHRAPTSVNIPATRLSTTSMPAVSAKQTTISMPAVTSPSSASVPSSRMTSGVVPAVEPRILRTKSGFLIALEQTSAETGDDVGQAMAQPIRDAAAGLLLATLDALHGTYSDPLSLFDGRADPNLQRSLIGEACVCVCYILYESLTRTSLPQMKGIQVVQSACVHALADKNMPVSEISRYLATESPREEFSTHVCALLGTRETTELQQRVEATLRGLRIDVKTCAEQIEKRLTRPLAAGGR
jgi:hypothetical protein